MLHIKVWILLTFITFDEMTHRSVRRSLPYEKLHFNSRLINMRLHLHGKKSQLFLRVSTMLDVLAAFNREKVSR